jgi:hypothetical protein
MTHPCWPDGAKVELGHLFDWDGTTYVVDGIDLGGIDGTSVDGAKGIGGRHPEQVTRVLPPRPVAGEIPEHLAGWLESTGLTADDVRNGTELYSSGGWMAELFEWAKALLVVDAQIVEDVEPRCAAERQS